MTDFNPSYTGSRSDILSWLPENAKKVLDIGCSVGTLGEQIKKNSKAEVSGIELNEDMAKIANGKLDKVIIGDIEKTDLLHYFTPCYFDVIIFADILEHLRDPWSVLKNSHSILNDKGIIIASIPNVRHYTTILNLVLKGYWPYRERGIHDRLHLRFFALMNIKEMFQEAGLEIIKVKRKYRAIERPHPYNKFSTLLALPIFRDFLTFQYLIMSKKIL